MPENEQPWVRIVGAIILGGAAVVAALIPPATKLISESLSVEANSSAVPAPAGRIEAPSQTEQQLKAVPAAAGDEQRTETALAAAGDEQRQQEAALEEARRAELANQPLGGLATLDAVHLDRANPALIERFRQQRERLSAQLAQLDAEPPSIELRRGFKLEYDKGTQVAVPLRIAGDLAVKSAECRARAEGGGSFQPVTVRHLTGDDYEVDIPPELHQNRTLELYATASDNSGHQSQLGSSDKPLKLKCRGRIWRGLFGKAGG